MKRLAQINDDGTLEIGGVRCRVVPVELTVDRRFYPGGYDQVSDAFLQSTWRYAVKSAAIDLSGLPRVPERIDIKRLPFPDVAIWETGWNAALDAIGVKK